MTAPIREVLTDQGHRVIVQHDGAAALDCMAVQRFDLIIADVRLPGADGLAILDQARKDPNTRVILMSAYGSIREAVSALRASAVHYLPKPFELSELLMVVNEVANQIESHRDASLAPPTSTWRNAKMEMIESRLAEIARTDAPVSISGEPGTGKSSLACEIHARSPRSGGPLVTIDCARLVAERVEDELFGARGKGQGDRGGPATASGGTLFLDGVDRLSMAAQAALLHALEREPSASTGPDSEALGVRLISTTTMDLSQLVECGEFSDELHRRLKVFHLELPPLRERREDLVVLVEMVRQRLSKQGKVLGSITAPAWEALASYAYPGNLRQLVDVLERAMLVSGGNAVDWGHLPPEVRDQSAVEPDEGFIEVQPLAQAVEQFEGQYLRTVLARAKYKKLRAAKMLRISRKTLWLKLRRHGIVAQSQHDRGAA